LIAECLILMSTFQSMAVVPSVEEMYEVKVCLTEEIPNALVDDIPYFVQFFEPENLDTAIRIAWCESRGFSEAYRSDNKDSGLFQFIPNTWKWMSQLYDIPEWDTWVITRYGLPHKEKNKTYKTNLGFGFSKVQHIPYYNIKAAAHLAEDTYKGTRWTDWNSSKWCWEDAKEWRERWTKEEN